MRMAHLGKTSSEETKKKLSQMFSGGNAPRYGKHHTDEAKKKMSDSRKGKGTGKDNPFYGRHHSDETKKVISEKLKGRFAGENNPNYGNHSIAGENNYFYGKHFNGSDNPNARKVAQYSKDGQLIKIWDYMKQASEELKINQSCLTECCRDRQKTAGGFVWRYVD